MSDHFKMWGNLIEAPDPDAYVPTESSPGPIGKFAQGLPVIQGRESGVATWTVMSLSDWHDLYGRWNSNKQTSGSFTIPPNSGDDWDTWRSIFGWADPPTSDYHGNQIHNVSVTIHVSSNLL